jgi:hypothetical protein
MWVWFVCVILISWPFILIWVALPTRLNRHGEPEWAEPRIPRWVIIYVFGPCVVVLLVLADRKLG